MNCTASFNNYLVFNRDSHLLAVADCDNLFIWDFTLESKINIITLHNFMRQQSHPFFVSN